MTATHVSRLFVDCDDTLVLWQKPERPDGLYLGSEYEMNVMLIADVSCFLQKHHEYDLIIWSGGGVKYAAMWAEKTNLGDAFKVTILDKDMRTPEADDIVVDDMWGELRPRDKRVRVVADLSRCPLCSHD